MLKQVQHDKELKMVVLSNTPEFINTTLKKVNYITTPVALLISSLIVSIKLLPSDASHAPLL